ncbi:putative toxin-antitoxin system, toxin component, RelE/ParE-like [Desulfonema limicola]|uniref:Toxin-antitoxin system, toxin component, RelE/ParE-like n=1 Tax=Desulfonema limicola TaxID=45656 RepID=A0A975GHB1_9BACT|nr:type II toxin-antitoxin system RelE/ParE family toxin [Desulfonema limicola]QTA81225.1 putative toxin-antitoxin system, toxin component, RelE/ParE-like [Desulfonema limicola]
MNVLKSKWFNKWSKKSKITDDSLMSAVENFDLSSVVDLGAGLYKLRIPRPKQGKSGGFRTLIIYSKNDLALFILGFAKNEKDNISTADLTDLKKQAKHILSFSKEQVDNLVNNGTFIKVEKKNEKRKTKQ